MSIKRRVYVSMPADPWLTPSENDLKWGLVERIEQLGYVPEIFTESDGSRFDVGSPGVERRCCPCVRIPLKSPPIPKQTGTDTGANRQSEKSERSDAGILFIA